MEDSTMKACANCGEQVPPRDGSGRPRRYCSDDCRWMSRHNAKGERRRCNRQRCNRFIESEGLCEVHLRLRRTNQPGWFARDKIIDWLSIDGGWLTAQGLAADLGHSVEMVEKVLRDLRREGVVESRLVELAYSGRSHGFDRRTEWRTA